ncbi:MAG TPA: hypothetical protein DD670_03385 [Planctomycetaceae bacterium]|nr:hypothetical protein [Planctomycetaceae bacterium]
MMRYMNRVIAFSAAIATFFVISAAVAEGAISLSGSLEHAVFQRDASNVAYVPLAGAYSGAATHIEARAVTLGGSYGTSTKWTTIDASPTGGSFNSEMAVSAGWYQVEVRAMNGSTVLSTATRPYVGVGEVFITAGQSNSAYYGGTLQTPGDARVSTWSGSTWQFGADSNPHVATGTNGSPWPDFGTYLVDCLEIPVGIIPVGVGSSSVQSWMPGNSNYNRLLSAFNVTTRNGFRAILWHQGEEDAYRSTSTATYASRLESVIAATRDDAGFDVPWGVARASWLNTYDVPAQMIVDAQNQVIANDPLVFGGPETNSFHSRGLTITPTNPHFNDAGLQEHGRLWKEAVVDFFNLQANPWEPPSGPTPAVKIQSGSSTAADPYSLGWRFTPTEEMVITSLGVFDAKGDGINNVADGGQLVCLFEWGGNESGAGACLVSAVVPTTAIAEPAGSFMAYYVDIEPLTLEVGKEYFIAATCPAYDLLYSAVLIDDEDRPFDRLACQGHATRTGSPQMPAHANTATFPVGPSGADDYFGGTFKYVVGVPEPSTLVLLSTLGLLVICRRR